MPARNATRRQGLITTFTTASRNRLVATITDAVVLALGLDSQDVVQFLETHEILTRAVEGAMISTQAGGATTYSSDD